MAFVSRKRVGCNGRKAVDQELCETGGGGGGDERGAEEEQAGRVAFARRAWRRRGEPSAPAAAIGSWQAGAGGGRGGRRAEEGDAAFCDAFCEEIGLLRLLPL